MEFTGERFVPGRCDQLLESEHRERYLFAAGYAKGKTVLDIACGTGYGSRMLKDAGALSVRGVDISEDAIVYANNNYGGEGITFVSGNAEQYKTGKYDLIVSFETVEHLDKRNHLLSNFREMLKVDGLLIISTPNKSITSPLKSPDKIRNTHHKYEYLEEEFVETLGSAGFTVIERFGQHPYPRIFSNQIISKLFRRRMNLAIEGASVFKIDGNTAKYFIFIAK